MTDLRIEAKGAEMADDWPSIRDLPSSAGGGPWSAVEYMFTHDKLRDVVYSEAGDTRRRVFHRRAFDALQDMGAVAAQLAHHAIAARLAAPAFRWSLAAADDAMRLFAVQTAIAHYEQARRLIGESSATATPEDVQRLYVQLGRAYEISGEPEQAQDAYGALLAFGQMTGQPSVESVAINRMATLSAQNFRDPETAMSLLQRARRAAQDSGELVQLAEIEWNLAQVSYYAVEVQGAYAYATRALALARELGHHELTARSLNVLAYVEENVDKWPDAEAHAEEAHALYVALGDRAMEVDSLCLLAKSCINDGRPRQAIDLAQKAQAISREIENPWGQVNCALHLTLGFMETGDYVQALEVGRQGADIARSYGITTILAVSLAALGNVERALLRLDAAHSTHQQALASSEAMARRPFTATIADELCADCALAGAWEEAYAYAQQARATRENSLYFYTGLTLWCAVEALLRGGERERAQEEVQRFGERIRDNRRYRIPYLRALAVLAQSYGAFDEALANLEAASTLAHEIGLPGEIWQIQAALSDLYRQRGDVGQARQLSVQAAASVQSLANRIEDQRLRTAFLTTACARHVLEAAQ
jgi:tetratricopeptide (TPR) repeat protein